MTGTRRQQVLDAFHLWTRDANGKFQAPWHWRNFGDELAPVILTDISPTTKVQHTALRHASLVMIGSILQRAALEALPGTAVIGSGVPGGLSARVIERAASGARNLDIRMVRGPLTRNLLQLPKRIELGDPALAINCDGYRADKTGKGLIVAHYSAGQSGKRMGQLLDHGRRLGCDVAFTWEDPYSMLQRITSAAFVLSTSLHGLILADLSGVPALPITHAPTAHEDFRFADYAATVGRTHHRRDPLHSLNANTAANMSQANFVDPGKIEFLHLNTRTVLDRWLSHA